ncbi:MAG: hypothetical protein AB7H80_14025, partial [Candidatus Kapaibacterium sp.]
SFRAIFGIIVADKIDGAVTPTTVAVNIRSRKLRREIPFSVDTFNDSLISLSVKAWLLTVALGTPLT